MIKLVPFSVCCDQNTLQFKNTSSEDHLRCWEVYTPSALTCSGDSEVKPNCVTKSKHNEHISVPLNEWLVHNSHAVNVALGPLHCSVVDFIGGRCSG